ncbi:MAG: kelch repeat-containing protein [Myxococcales bacterium]|nr:kelch repeat-containing protein [Myxococcales bacterium]MBL0195661.1 kelch repeat-containing protein [Myxococcales bacterium]
MQTPRSPRARLVTFMATPRLRLGLAIVVSCGGTPPSVPSDATSPTPTLSEAGAPAPLVDAASPSDAGGDGGSWSPLPALAGGPRQETAVVALGRKLYVIGGFDAKTEMSAAVEVFDPSAGTWSSAAPLPNALHHANAAAVDGKLYVVGALGSSFRALSLSIAYDPATNTWTPRASLPLGAERGASGVAVVGTKIYVAGGLRGGAVALFSAYDTTADTWEDLPAIPAPSDHLVAGAVGTTVYLIGGRQAAITSHTARVDAYDTLTRTWSARAPMPTSRGGAAAAVVGARVVVAGGEGDTSRPSGVFDQVESYEPATDRWTKLAPMRSPRHGTGAAAIGGKVYVPGGADRQAFGAVATFEAFTPFTP